MKHIFLLLFLLSAPLLAITVDPSARSFQMRQQNKRIDTFDFSGEFPQLENIDIDAKRKKRVAIDLSGDYPLLSSVNYEGSFGYLKGDLTGHFSSLSFVNLLCTNCVMQLDLSGDWQKNCHINIRGQGEDITIKLPEEVGLIIHTRTSPSGKVLAKEGLKKQGWLKVWKKTYHNELAQTADIILTLNIESTSGRIILN